MTGGGEMGAYMLGASIAGNHAREMAYLDAKATKRKFDRERQDLYAENKRLAIQFYYESLRGEMRRHARSVTKQILDHLLKNAENGRISVSAEELNRLFAHELDPATTSSFALERLRVIATAWIGKTPEFEENIRAALAQLEKEYA